ncbi:hypothetical protein LTR97_012866 [Elasticomyces elasticus]|uniref:Uncharacterized protein n=1 Tax=Elasticomyces elasticus TaxID=574655 RepID=A0AAN7VZ73_9PEZI|nr:hypothetical protein LTR97_012866 [Elasticomyces elasticus]
MVQSPSMQLCCRLQALPQADVKEQPAPASTTPWLDLLPAEIRIDIFGYALCCRDEGWRINYEHRKNNTSIALLIALVNDPKYGEAYEAFYSCQSFALDYYQELHALNVHNKWPNIVRYITHLELANFANYKEFLGSKAPQTSVLALCSRQPKLRSLTIAYDAQNFGSYPFRRQLENGDSLRGHELTCVASWSEAKQSPHDWPTVTLAVADTCQDDWTLAQWVATFDEVVRSGGEWPACRPDYEQEVLTDFLFSLNNYVDSHLIPNIAEIFAAVSAGTSLLDLDAKGCSAAMLEAISEWVCFCHAMYFSGILVGSASYGRQQRAQRDQLWPSIRGRR